MKKRTDEQKGRGKVRGETRPEIVTFNKLQLLLGDQLVERQTLSTQKERWFARAA